MNYTNNLHLSLYANGERLARIMGKLRFFCALLIAKLSIIALKITRHNGTNFPGIVAIRICPNFLEYIELPDKIIGITGTNGKTTCSNLLNDALLF